jgi:hypothetical protein
MASLSAMSSASAHCRSGIDPGCTAKLRALLDWCIAFPVFATPVSDPPLSFPSLSFPALLDEGADRLQWPVPPFAWRKTPSPCDDIPQPCRLESQTGAVVDGEMLSFDPAGHTLSFRNRADSPAVSVSFSRLRRLTLNTPLKPDPPIAGTQEKRVPVAEYEREYTLHSSGKDAPLTGRTAGHMETSEGMYLFTPVEEETSLQRVFVPRSAYLHSEFGPSAEEVAARLWIASPAELLEAIERQQRKAVQPLGQSLLALGLLTQRQLDRALARPPDNMPLGESLVAAGTISRADLQTALAHKMRYPLVDLMRFPIDPAAVSKLSPPLAKNCRAMPLMLDKGRLIVAVDEPSSGVKLQAIHAFAQLKVVAVLATQLQLMLALDRLSSKA